MTRKSDSLDAKRRDDMRDWCQIKRCRHESGLIYKGVGLCDAHWTAACQDGSGTTTYLAENLCDEAIAVIDWS